MDKFNTLLKEISDLYSRKNQDYAGKGNKDPFKNFREAEKLGIKAWKGVLVRMSDKWTRIGNLINQEAKNESIEDSLLDLAIYSMICLLLKREENE